MSKVKLEVGMRIAHPIYGDGKITVIDNSEYLPIGVTYDNGTEFGYFADGEIFRNKLLNIPFTEAMEVECDIYGSGTVCNAKGNGSHPIGVFFNSGVLEVYTADGRINKDANITLFPKYEI